MTRFLTVNLLSNHSNHQFAFLRLSILMCLYLLSTIPLVNAQMSSTAAGPHIEVSLLQSKSALVPGDTIELGVLFSPEVQWHTYWRNPGDSGEAPTIKWSANQTLEFGEIQWPLPYSIRVAHLVNYGYEGENLLVVPVTVPSNIVNSIDPIVITADISWLVCKEDCIPGWATLQISIPIADYAEPSAAQTRFLEAKAKLPNLAYKEGRFEVTANQVVFEIQGLDKRNWHLFPFKSDLINHAAEQQFIVDGQDTRVIVPRSDYFDGKAEELTWLISDGEVGFYVKGAPSDASMQLSTSHSLSALLLFMLMAFAGGLILNLMPCVLPILSIKAIALQNVQHNIRHKLAYLVGVIVCFNLFAIIIVLLQQSGQQVGWGFHMQEPIVVSLLAFLFTFVALVLLDAMPVSGRFAGVGQSLVSGDTAKSHFATGALAVIVASPCTAPFMAAALGVALVSETYITFLLFNALAVGFALPLTLLFMSKKAMSWLPKPGQWMVTFKHILAFPMFATVAWLTWVYAAQLGAQAQFVLLIGLILFCMFTWLLGSAKGNLSKTIFTLAITLSIALPLWLSITMPTLTQSKGQQTTAYEHFDKDRLNELRSENQIVVVNMTADWCITCKVNEQIAFASDEVKTALAQDKVQYMVGDWTNKNDEILQYLSQYERAGVPLYVVYAGTKSKQILPQILSPNTLIDAINQAKKELNSEK